MNMIIKTLYHIVYNILIYMITNSMIYTTAYHKELQANFNIKKNLVFPNHLLLKNNEMCCSIKKDTLHKIPSKI